MTMPASPITAAPETVASALYVPVVDAITRWNNTADASTSSLTPVADALTRSVLHVRPVASTAHPATNNRCTLDVGVTVGVVWTVPEAVSWQFSTSFGTESYGPTYSHIQQPLGVPDAGAIAPVSDPSDTFHDICMPRALPPLACTSVPPVH